MKINEVFDHCLSSTLSCFRYLFILFSDETDRERVRRNLEKDYRDAELNVDRIVEGIGHWLSTCGVGQMFNILLCFLLFR